MTIKLQKNKWWSSRKQRPSCGGPGSGHTVVQTGPSSAWLQQLPPQLPPQGEDGPAPFWSLGPLGKSPGPCTSFSLTWLPPGRPCIHSTAFLSLRWASSSARGRWLGRAKAPEDQKASLGWKGEAAALSSQRCRGGLRTPGRGEVELACSRLLLPIYIEEREKGIISVVLKSLERLCLASSQQKELSQDQEHI